MLDEHAPVISGRLEQSFLQVGAVVALAHAHGRSHVGRFGEKRVAAHLFGLADDGFHTIFDLAACGNERIYHGNSVGNHDIFEDAFIHTNGGADHTRAHISHVCHFEQALNRAVFRVSPVHNREKDIDVCQFDILVAAQCIQTMLRWVRG